ncbi:MAG: hypothetical protein ACTHLE_02525 [Agriterribacter sp.]
MNAFKQKVHAHYLQSIYDKIKILEQALADLKESGSNETKRTAGDKHETALAMLQIEQENKRRQLKEAQEQLAIFNRIDFSITSSRIIAGSLVRTNRGYLFVSIAGGKSTIDGQQVIALSAQSPLGMKLIGASINDIVTVNNLAYKIEEIW